MQLSDLAIDQRVTVSGSNRSNGPGKVTRLGRKYVYVLIDGNEKEGQYLPSEVFPQTFTSNPSHSYLQSLAAERKLTSTRQYSHVKPEVTLNAAQRRARRNGATRYSLSLA